MAHYASSKLEDERIQQSDVEATQRTRFDESISFDFGFDEDSLSDAESIERSYKQLDGNFLFRFLMIICLRKARLFSSSKTDLIKLFETQYHIGSENINRFQETYSSNKAIFFYTRDEFIYGKLNNALRTLNIKELLSFQFIYQDICNELYDKMPQTTDNQTLTVFRGHRSTPFEVADLFIAYCKKSFIMSTSFLSTSKNEDIALFFLSTTGHTIFDLNHSIVLFKITIRKPNPSFDFPFADISKISNHPEEAEVLFAPGQIFNIDDFDIIWKNDTNIFVFNISLNDKFNEKQMELKCLSNTMNPWFTIGRILTDNKQYHEAKELYMRLISEYDDKDEIYKSYQGLYHIAKTQDNQIEMQNIDRKMTELKFGFIPPDTYSSFASMTNEEHDIYVQGSAHFKKMFSSMSPARPINELLSFIQSDEYRTGTKQLLDSVYPLAKILTKYGIYDVAINILETILRCRNIFPGMSPDLLHIARYYIQLGHCYRELKSNAKALENYYLAMEQNAPLPLDEQVETLLGLGKILEDMNNYGDALDRYIEAAKIYNNNSMVGDATQRRSLEQTIQQVLSNLIPTNDTCKTS
jgi:tetratricopeptide (TPR) repeat protein